MLDFPHIYAIFGFMQFKYTDLKSKQKASASIIIEADNILVADNLYRDKTGFDVLKCPWIACEVVVPGRKNSFK